MLSLITANGTAKEYDSSAEETIWRVVQMRTWCGLIQQVNKIMLFTYVLI